MTPTPMICDDWVGRAGETVEYAGYERETFRVNLFRDSIRITRLANAGKRGRTVPVLHVDGWRGDAGKWANFLIAIRPFALTGVFIERVKAEAAERGYETSESETMGVRVRPFGVEPVEIGNDAFSFSFDPVDGFRGADLTDRHNDPRYISCSRTGMRGIAKAYKLAKAGALDACETFHAAISVLSEGGVSGHYFCAVD